MDFDIEKIRYHKVIIMTDADVDGSHIRTLLLTFFYRHMPQLIADGHLFLAVPPLYRVDIGKETHWAQDEEEKAAIVANAKGRAVPQVTRFKGLGEMNPETLKLTTLNPDSRAMLRVTIDDDRSTDTMIKSLMGRDVAPRYELIMERAAAVADVDI